VVESAIAQPNILRGLSGYCAPTRPTLLFAIVTVESIDWSSLSESSISFASCMANCLTANLRVGQNGARHETLIHLCSPDDRQEFPSMIPSDLLLVLDRCARAQRWSFGQLVSAYGTPATQAHRLGPRGGWIATTAQWPGSLQRMVRHHHCFVFFDSKQPRQSKTPPARRWRKSMPEPTKSIQQTGQRQEWYR
jgi:hypothetical protein